MALHDLEAAAKHFNFKFKWLQREGTGTGRLIRLYSIMIRNSTSNAFLHPFLPYSTVVRSLAQNVITLKTEPTVHSVELSKLLA